MIDLGFEGEMRVVDVETTGLYPTPTKKDPTEHNIISVCVMPITFNQDGPADAGDPQTWVVNPGRSIPVQATKVNGFRDKDVYDLPPFADVAQEIRDAIGKHPLVGHNVAFDKRFLQAEFQRAGITGVNRNKPVCTMEATAKLMAAVGRHSDKWGWLNLDRTLSLLNSVAAKRMRRKSNTHGAQEDVELTGAVASILHQLSTMPKDKLKGVIRNMIDAWPEEQDKRELHRERARRNRNNADADEQDEGFGCFAWVGVAVVVGVLLLALA
ncbi:MAG: 3'-5' exonuclease [Gammaproteobacteria bacterium]|nr:3'-5' exonuclease [Gammaproteobacteria bacterium]